MYGCICVSARLRFRWAIGSSIRNAYACHRHRSEYTVSCRQPWSAHIDMVAEQTIHSRWTTWFAAPDIKFSCQNSNACKISQSSFPIHDSTQKNLLFSVRFRYRILKIAGDSSPLSMLHTADTKKCALMMHFFFFFYLDQKYFGSWAAFSSQFTRSTLCANWNDKVCFS